MRRLEVHDGLLGLHVLSHVPLDGVPVGELLLVGGLPDLHLVHVEVYHARGHLEPLRLQRGVGLLGPEGQGRPGALFEASQELPGAGLLGPAHRHAPLVRRHGPVRECHGLVRGVHVHGFVCGFVRGFVRGLVRGFVRDFIHGSVRRLVRGFVRDFLHGFVSRRGALHGKAGRGRHGADDRGEGRADACLDLQPRLFGAALLHELLDALLAVAHPAVAAHSHLRLTLDLLLLGAERKVALGVGLELCQQTERGLLLLGLLLSGLDDLLDERARLEDFFRFRRRGACDVELDALVVEHPALLRDREAQALHALRRGFRDVEEGVLGLLGLDAGLLRDRVGRRRFRTPLELRKPPIQLYLQDPRSEPFVEFGGRLVQRLPHLRESLGSGCSGVLGDVVLRRQPRLADGPLGFGGPSRGRGDRGGGGRGDVFRVVRQAVGCDGIVDDLGEQLHHVFCFFDVPAELDGQPSREVSLLVQLRPRILPLLRMLLL
mmetsp:Transcript_44471/g.105604  ORF Transcript_44471/g.105604 Transcript_44471/m.105604 type:complete len:489 (-) Transcript_44471:420-1886(-)